MSNLTTQQTIKVKVNQLDGSLVPQNKVPVVLKNTVQGDTSIGHLGNVNEGTPTDGATLVYNTSTGFYDVKVLSLQGLSDVSGTPSDGDIIIYEATSNTFLYGTPATSVVSLVDVDSTSRANGTVLQYDSSSNTYKHVAVLTANSSGSLGPVQVSSFTIGTGGGGAVNITSLSTFANSTQLGSNSAGSATELVTAKAVKDYVDTMIAASGGGGGGGAVNLNGLVDVYINGGGLINRQVLLFDGNRNEWVNRDIHGVANNIWMTTNANNDIVIALANDVAIANTLTVPSANIANLTSSSLTVSNTVSFANSLGVGGQLSVARAATFGNNITTSGTLSVTGNATFANQATFVGNVSFTNTVTIQANTTIGQRLTVGGVANLVANVGVSGILNTTGNVVVGNTQSTVVIDARLASDIIPSANNTYSLGSTGMRFKDVYVSPGTLYLGDVVISTASGKLSIDSGMDTQGVATFSANVITNDHLIANSNAIFNANVTIGDSSSDRLTINSLLASNVVPSSNLTYNIGSSSSQFANVYTGTLVAGNGNFSGDVNISGSLYVAGDVTRISVATMEVEDSLIQLSSNNASDSLDIGFYGLYKTGGANTYAGLFRDASNSGKFTLFTGLSAYPTTTVDTSNASFNVATLISYLDSGGLVTRSDRVAITANSTVQVAIVANTLTLSSSLGVASGGLGRSNPTLNAVLVGNGTDPVKQVTGSTMQLLSVVGGVPTFVSSVDAGEY